MACLRCYTSPFSFPPNKTGPSTTSSSSSSSTLTPSITEQVERLKRLTNFSNAPNAHDAPDTPDKATPTQVVEPTEATGIPEGAIGYCEHVVVGYGRDKIYKVVSDVARYDAFLPWCVSSVVRGTEKNASGMTVRMDAQIGVGFSLLKQDYVSDTRFYPKERITARLVGEGSDALLEYLECEWTFTKKSGATTEVDFEVVFKFKNPIHNHLTSLVLSQIVETMVTSFHKRLEELYGPASQQLLELPLRDPTKHNAEPSAGTPTPSLSTLMQYL